MLPDNLIVMGYKVGREELTHRDSEGGFVVFKANNPNAKRDAAVKLWIDDEKVKSIDFRNAFIWELRSNEMLARPGHPNIVHYIGGDLNQEEGYAYLMSDFIPNGTLRERLAQTNNLGIEAALATALDTLQGLEYIHRTRSMDGAEVKMVHGDNHDGNIVYDATGRAVLLDFGHARLVYLQQPKLFPSVPSVKGFSQYGSPEEKAGEKSVPLDDLFRVGKVLAITLGRGTFDESGSLLKLGYDYSGLGRRQVEEIEDVVDVLSQKRSGREKYFPTAEALSLRLRQIRYVPEVEGYIDQVRGITSSEQPLEMPQINELGAIRKEYAAFAAVHGLDHVHSDIERMVQDKCDSDIGRFKEDLQRALDTETSPIFPDEFIANSSSAWRRLGNYNEMLASEQAPMKAKK